MARVRAIATATRTANGGLITNDRLTYGISELAEKMGVSPGFLRLEIQRGRLHVVKRGARVLVTRAAVEKYLLSPDSDA